MILTSILLSSAPSSSGAPVELLANNGFKNGLEGWTAQGLAFLDGESIKILREGSLSQIVRRTDLSFYLEFSYNVRTELPSKKYFARSLVTFYMIDRQRIETRFTVLGQVHEELGDSGWKEIRLNLLQLFRDSVGDPGNYQLAALGVTVELGFTSPASPFAVAYFRDISLKRVNPVKILLVENGYRELPDRTELLVSVTNVGDIDASNLVVTLIPAPELFVVSRTTAFARPALDGGLSWQVSWMLAARSSGMHPVTIRASCDQAVAELSLGISVPGIAQITTTQTVTVTAEQTVDQFVVMSLQTAFFAMVAFLIVAIIIPLFRSRRGAEVVFRLRG